MPTDTATKYYKTGKCCCECCSGTGCAGASALPAILVGGLAAPFSNPCFRTTGPPFQYCNRDMTKTAVPATVNHTLITTDAGCSDTGPVLVRSRQLSGIGRCGAESVNDYEWPRSYYPPFWGLWGATFRPANVFQSVVGTVDLSGPCRTLGRQQAQFLRWWHGMFGFDVRTDGITCDSYAAHVADPSVPVVYTGTKYRTMQVITSATSAGCSVTRTQIRKADSAVIGSKVTSFSGAVAYNLTMTVAALSGVRTMSGQEDANSAVMTVGEYDGSESTFAGNTLFDPGHYGHIEAPLLQYSCGTWSVFGSTFTTADLITWLSNPINIGNAEGNTHDSMGNTYILFQVTGLTVTAAADRLLIEVVIGANAPVLETDDGTDLYTATPAGTATYHLEIQLSDLNTSSTLEADISGNLEPLWDFNDRAKHPFRTDNLCTVAELYTRNEVPYAVSPHLFPISTTNGTVNGGFAVDDRSNYLGGGNYAQISWFDDAAWMWVYPYGVTDVASGKLLIYDGSALDAAFAAGTGAGTVADSTSQKQGCFDFSAAAYSGANGCSSVYAAGAWSPLIDSDSDRPAIPPSCKKWTDSAAATTFFPCEFAYFGLDKLQIQRWREAQIHVPSENVCRPFGADKAQLDWTAIHSCDADGKYHTTDDGTGTAYTTPPFKWPNCPGMVFSNVAGVGGRVAVTANIAGVVTLNISQPYLCLDAAGTTPITETVNVFDSTMTLLGDATAVRVDATHFSGFTLYPTAAWITPKFRNDGTTPWVYSDCDNYPKGHWVSENYSYDITVGAAMGTPTSHAYCVAAWDKCKPSIMQASVSAPGYSLRVNLAVVKQWQVSEFEVTQKCCDGSTLRVRPYFTNDGASPCGGAANACYLPQFVEATAGGDNCPAPASGDACSPGTTAFTPWNIFLNCPDAFPL